MSDEVEELQDGVDPVLRYGATMVIGLLIAGFVGVWLEVGFRNGAAVGVPIGILAGWLLRPRAVDDGEDHGPV